MPSMAELALNDRSLTKLERGPRDRRRLKVAGAPKLYVSVDARALTYQFRYRLPGMVGGLQHPLQVITVGTTATLSPRQAEDEAMRLDAMLKAGRDPKVELQSETAARVLAASLHRSVDVFLVEYLA